MNNFYYLQVLQSHHDETLVIKDVEKYDDEEDRKMKEKKIPHHVGHPIGKHPYARKHLNYQGEMAFHLSISQYILLIYKDNCSHQS